MRTIKNNKTYLVFPRELSETIDKLLGKRKRSQGGEGSAYRENGIWHISKRREVVS